MLCWQVWQCHELPAQLVGTIVLVVGWGEANVLYLPPYTLGPVERTSANDNFREQIPLLHVLCCHLSHPSHWMPSCLALTGSLQQMHKSWWAIVTSLERWSVLNVLSVVKQPATRSEWNYVGFSRFLYALRANSAETTNTWLHRWSSYQRWLMLHACIFSCKLNDMLKITRTVPKKTMFSIFCHLLLLCVYKFSTYMLVNNLVYGLKMLYVSWKNDVHASKLNTYQKAYKPWLIMLATLSMHNSINPCIVNCSPVQFGTSVTLILHQKLRKSHETIWNSHSLIRHK